MHPWARRNIPQLAGRLALVTGANSGLGWQAARTLAGKGATVVMACRNREQAERARRAILDEYPQARLELADLELADLASIRACAAGFRQRHARRDLLFNNAGVMFLPLRRTRDGFEMQMGTNHLGHFALTGLLLDSLLAAPRPRVVGMTSGFNQFGRLPLDDLTPSAATTAISPIATASRPICCSAWSCSAAPASGACFCRAWRRIRATRRPTCSTRRRRCPVRAWDAGR